MTQQSIRPETGYSYPEAKRLAKKLSNLITGRNTQLRVTYGTRTSKFHFILPEDKDYEHFSLSPAQFARTPNKQMAKEYLIRPRFWSA